MSEPIDDAVSDEELIARLRKGDRSVTESLTLRYWDAIQRYCASYLNDAALAEDVSQETFARLLDAEALPTGAFRPWIYKVARNRCLDILRRHKRSPTHDRPLRTGVDAIRRTAGPRTRAAREERRALIREIIERMPEDYRSVLMLKHFEHFSRSEIAESLGVSEAAVKGRLVRASQFLEEELAKITGSQ